MKQAIKDYYELTKPRLIYGNLVTTAAGFVFGSRGLSNVNVAHFIFALAAITFIMASGCAFNNLIDRDIDKIMERTKSRASARGKIRVKLGVIFAMLLLGCGLYILFSLGMNLAAYTVLFGFFVYAGLYSLWGKRRSRYGTFIGAIAGATPPLAGYAAASGGIDIPGIAIFAMMLAWQMPHAWAIAIYRKSDYAAARIPVLPVTDPGSVKSHMLRAIGVFAIIALIPYALNRAGIVYATTALLLSIFWWIKADELLPAKNNGDEARMKNAGFKLFRFSLLVIMGVFITLMFDAK